MHERLAAPQRGERAPDAPGGRRAAPGRPRPASTPVATRMATRTTATSRTAAPAVPRPAWSGRPTSCAEIAAGVLAARRESEKGGEPLASSARPQTPSTPSTVADGEAPGVGALVLLVVVVEPGPIEQQRQPGADGDQRQEDAGPAGHQRQAGVDAVADRAELLAPQGQRQEDAERDQPDGPQVAGLDGARTAAAAGRRRPLGPAGRLLGGRAGGARRRRPRGSWSPQWGRDYWLTWSFLWTPHPLNYEHMFAIVAAMALRWALAENEEGGTLFADERVAERHVGKGAYAGMEFLHVNARTIINTVPAESRMPFRHTINPYRGCSHACVYCFARPTHDYLGLGHRRPTSSARSSSRSTPSSGCGPSCARRAGTATTSPWAPTPTPTSTPRASTT